MNHLNQPSIFRCKLAVDFRECNLRGEVVAFCEWHCSQRSTTTTTTSLDMRKKSIECGVILTKFNHDVWMTSSSTAILRSCFLQRDYLCSGIHSGCVFKQQAATSYLWSSLHVDAFFPASVLWNMDGWADTILIFPNSPPANEKNNGKAAWKNVPTVPSNKSRRWLNQPL